MTSIIIPLYLDRIDLYPIIDRCIKSYKPAEGRELILMDDASPLSCEDWPITFQNPKNLGYTGNCNKGVEIATGDKLWIVNDDVEFNDEILVKLDDIEDGTIYLPKWAGEPFDTHNKFGFFYGMTRDTWDKLGGLDTNMKHFFSDLDMWKRANKEGVRIEKWDIEVFHYSGATYRGRDDYFQQGMAEYYKKHGMVD